VAMPPMGLYIHELGGFGGFWVCKLDGFGGWKRVGSFGLVPDVF